jgi:predicted phosphodiesterase
MDELRIVVFSDLHLEFDRAIAARGGGRKASRSRKALQAEGHPAIGPNLAALPGACDVVVLAGDVDLGVAAIDYAAALAGWLAVPVVLIAGNHEFYHGTHRPTLDALRDRACAATGVHFLENDRLDLAVGSRAVRFLGCTLWTDFALFGAESQEKAKEWAAHAMTDFRGTITIEGGWRFEPDDALALHQRSRAWLEAEFAADFNGVTVVVSHHAPSHRSVSEQYRRDLLSAAYASNLDALLKSGRAALWVHGHTHTSMDYNFGRTRVIFNPRGYRLFELNKGFDSSLIVTL